MTKYVFKHNDRVIDEARKGKRQTCQNHGIDRPAAHANADKGRQRRQRNRQKDREGRAYAPEEEQNHQCCQNKTYSAFTAKILQSGLDKDRLVEDHGRLE